MSRSANRPTVVMLALTLLACAPVVAETGDERPHGPSQPVSVERVSPVYPRGASDVTQDVEVVVAVKVLSDGTVGEAIVARSTIPGVGFEQSAVEAVSQWRFRPAETGGSAVDSTAYITLNYRTPDPSYFERPGGYSTLVPPPDRKDLVQSVRSRDEARSLQLPYRRTLRSASAQYKAAHIRGTRMVDKRKIQKPPKLVDATSVRGGKSSSPTVKTRNRR